MDVRIAVVTKDGRLSETTSQGIEILKKVTGSHGHRFRFNMLNDLGQTEIDECKKSDAVIIGHHSLNEAGVRELRTQLGAVARLMPLGTHENCEGGEVPNEMLGLISRSLHGVKPLRAAMSMDGELIIRADLFSKEVVKNASGLTPYAVVCKSGIDMHGIDTGVWKEEANIKNPAAAVMACAMMLRHTFNLETEAQELEAALRSVLKSECPEEMIHGMLLEELGHSNAKRQPA
ncbi:isocitrate/isopropylmalate dehydrogenase [Peptoclostridium acidaminophilum DSM 3953]|uniref:Isocitrate/isopropylmalate dehydrogenase n=1 Tax=Peptoclostridium acidaminophilum DSM 3953 TaxID=1286171 RepID=W8T3L8_PEPAC|nr:isocitrate/isopropylmalate family dehydrogenase [Peptoclostridium acidaminophilum]AHM55425.1 isocitrate/isopropylmalate dehydrogenase [Peptoclostridium acidaminophilum DSM 3953]